MADNTIAQAYVQILPTTEGIQSQLTEQLGGPADAAGREAGGSWTAGFGGMLKTGAVAAAEYAANAAMEIGQQAFEGFAQYEQLSGGIETLFGDSADAVMAHASEAFKTAGMDANSYMETVTGFSAALIQSTGRGAQQDLAALEDSLDAQYTATKRNLEDQYDEVKKYWDNRIKATKNSAAKESLRAQRDAELKDMKRANEDQLNLLKQHNKDLLAEAAAANSASVTTEESLAKAAELANMAITDMSDNANKMGADMSSIQAAYQGFSKQNYTMLDNLKLGYGGTKEEMERLLHDAEQISGIQYDISSYADIVQAIHVVQTEMGITGTTAREASETIEGSTAAAQAAWSNLVTGLADENADIEGLVDEFVNSAITAGENILPRIGVIMEGAGTLITEGAKTLIPVLIDGLAENTPMLVENGIELVTALIVGLIQATPQLLAAVPDIVLAIGQGLINSGPMIVQAGDQLMTELGAVILDYASDAVDWAGDLVSNFARSVMDHISTAVAPVTQMGDRIKDAFLSLTDHAKQWGRDLIQNFIDGLMAKFEALKSSVRGAAQTVRDFLGFSEPKEGPLSDFHEFPRDMMQLFGEGIEQNEELVTSPIKRVFDLRELITSAPSQILKDNAQQPVNQESGRPIILNATIVNEMDGEQLSRKTYQIYLDESNRHGPSLITA